jgi:lipoprotein-releasing system ATP-binding protein
MSNAVIAASNLTKSFTDGDLETHVLASINLTVNKGDRLAIVGSSGSGKSTLLHILGGLDTPTEGEVLVSGQNIHAMKSHAASRLRNQQLGFVYQFHHLLPEFTAVENVAMPLVIGGQAPKAAQQQARELLERVGLGHRLEHKPGELSGGERQRAALARALITKPACLLADEPTGNLDHRTAQSIFDLLLELNTDLGTALVIVTHDTELAAKMDKVSTLMDGVLQS